MANTSDVYDVKNALFQEVNAETVDSMVPVVVVISVLMTAGLIGNCSVFYYYGFKIKRTASSYFILVLAAFDLVMSAVGMPMEIVDIRLFYTFDNDVVCKTLKFIDAFVAIGSFLTLLVIGFDRYRRICSPFKRQIEKRHSKLLSVAATVTSLALSWPTFFLYAIQDVIVTTEKGTVVGKDCTFTKDKSYHRYLIALNSVYLGLFLIIMAILLTMYLLIVRAIFKQMKTRRSYLSTSMSSLGSKVTVSGKDKTPDKSFRNKSLLQSFQDITGAPNDFIIDKKTVKFTLLMLTVTSVILLGFVPYLTLSLWRLFKGKHPSETLTAGELVAFQIGIRSVLLNAALNPLIYGFFNAKFRYFWYRTVCCFCREDVGSQSVEEES